MNTKLPERHNFKQKLLFRFLTVRLQLVLNRHLSVILMFTYLS